MFDIQNNVEQLSVKEIECELDYIDAYFMDCDIAGWGVPTKVAVYRKKLVNEFFEVTLGSKSKWATADIV